MDRFDRIYRLNSIIKRSRFPVSKSNLKTYLECSDATVERAIQDMRDGLSAPIVYDREHNGYHYDESEDAPYELPGLWFNGSELFALIACQQLLKDIQPGLLDESIKPLTDRVKSLLSKKHLGHENLEQRVKLIQQASRPVDNFLFQQIITAIATRKKIQCTYHARGSEEISNRTISPQRIVHYRDNWYLDAWCHKREALRTFAVEKILSCGILPNDAIDIDQPVLDEHFASAFGIFAGQADKTAVLEFSKKYAQWVADESWHPEQKGEWLESGRYRLTVPYKHSEELVMDILKYGAHVEVVGPEGLRQKVVDIVGDMQKVYGNVGGASRDEGVDVG